MKEYGKLLPSSLFFFSSAQARLYTLCKLTTVRQHYFGLWAADSVTYSKGQGKSGPAGPAAMVAIHLSLFHLCAGQFNPSSFVWLSRVTFD